ncbi:sulfatase-like hydrolase/transferase [Halobellus sp. H-GB7]|uniref:sulfatase-like hydrolase/transferase n=1 Tax=Halobellus sp. H-GB7 TaxID=3069756 RepID=UPI0027B07A20|nr:sulfatase-like hydrolase/transferase [Halobellus sp. H-GB7]MDQ2054672.1 sulfatase-like hydrolase/transferase [Halobellus sp. H-GB7]
MSEIGDSSDSKPPNILLVVLDSVRAKNCSTYGYSQKTTPYLTKFAKGATLYEQARSPSIHSISSHASIFSGYHVEEHNVIEHTSYLDPTYNIWHELGQEYGYETGIFSPNVVITETSNLSGCFDTKVGPKRTNFKIFEMGGSPLDIQGKVDPVQYLRYALRHDRPVRSVLNGLYSRFTSRGGAHNPEKEGGDVYVDELLDWITGRDGQWAACLNLMDAHSPYEPERQYNQWGDQNLAELYQEVQNASKIDSFSKEFWEKLSALEPLYDGCIRQADAAVEQLVEGLRQEGELENTFLVITSDHGEGFGEPSRLTSARLRSHSWGIGEVLTQVPLLVKKPGQTQGSRIERVASLTQFPDVVRSVVEDGESTFVPEDKPVVSSTFRIMPPGNELPLDEGEREPYFGPWRAVYRDSKDGVLKFASRREDMCSLRIRGTEVTEISIADSKKINEEVFDRMTDSGVKLGKSDERDVSEDVEDRLADLGYLR